MSATAWGSAQQVQAAHGGDLEKVAIVDTRKPGVRYEMGSAVAHVAPERTYAMIKPDAVAKGASDAIVDAIKAKGFKVIFEERGTTLTEARPQPSLPARAEPPPPPTQED